MRYIFFFLILYQYIIAQRRENARISNTLNETPTTSKQKSVLLSPVSEHQDPKLMKSNGESTLVIEGTCFLNP